MIRNLSFAPLLGSLSMLVACTSVSVGSGAASPGCGPGGANENQHVVGDQPGGVQLGLGEIAVAPNGSYVIFEGKGRLSVGWPATGRVEDLPIVKPTKLAFSKKRDVVYVGSDKDFKLHAIDVRTKKELWASPLDGPDATGFRIESSDDDTRVITAGLTHLTLHDAATGARVAEQGFEQTIVDIALPSTGARALVVTQETWSKDTTPLPTSKVAVVALNDGKTRAFDVPNCASRLAVTRDGSRAFLSPTSCSKDPVSLIDLTPGTETWVKNLPGFGPLAMARDGASAVAFLDAHNVDEALFDDPALIPPHGANDPSYYIMTLDTKSLAYQFTAVGNSLPRYALTPDGNVLLVDAVDALATLRLFDTKTHTFREVMGPHTRLDNFVISSDALHVYAIWAGLIDIDVQASVAQPVVLPFTPLNINIAPDDQTLFLRSSPSEVCVFSVKTRQCATTFSGAVATTP